MTMRKYYVVGLVLMLLFLGVACQGDDEEVQEAEPEEEPVEEEVEVEEEESPYRYVLTGLEADDEYVNRILAVMVNNANVARPQTGLIDADIVYEFLAEGAITRFLALYQSTIPEVVGPVRSARSYYIDTARDHGAIYIYHGAADFIEEDLRAGWVDNLNGAYYDNDEFLFKRESFRKAPHNSYVLLEHAYDVASRNNIETEREHEWVDFYEEDELSQITGEAVSDVNVRYYDQQNVSYTYDPVSEKFERFADGEPSIDLVTEEQLSYDNVLIYETHHEVIDAQNRRFIDLESGGKGYLLQKGTIQEIEWRNVDGLMYPYIGDEQAKLVPGKTWINIIPDSPGIAENVTYEAS